MAWKEGRDESLKQFSTQLHPIYIFIDAYCIFSLFNICRVGLYTELFYAILPTLFLCFLLIC